jgi:acyl-CoA reductase-like NAD-dependent aldehyde dehydrogenase
MWNYQRHSKKEVFDPVAPIIVTEDDKNALDLTNDNPYGLGASIWTPQDIDKADRIAREIDAGVVTVNNVVASDPRMPFGGVKKSGFGRELSRYGMLEFVNIKSIRFYDELVLNHHVSDIVKMA